MGVLLVGIAGLAEAALELCAQAFVLLWNAGFSERDHRCADAGRPPFDLAH